MPQSALLQRRNETDLATQELLVAAQSARLKAFAPYSNYLVGAAARDAFGNVHTGANFETAAYFAIHAEMAAISAAVNAYPGDGPIDLCEFAIVGDARNSIGASVTTPCGLCRQFIAEIAVANKRDILIWSANSNLSNVRSSTISELLPEAFSFD